MIKENSTVEEIFQSQYYQDEYLKLVSALNSAFDRFYQKYSRKEFTFFVKGRFRLEHLVKSYCYDEIRYKLFHLKMDDSYLSGSKKSFNVYKETSYLLKWLIRVKPFSVRTIELRKISQDLVYFCITLNEHFACHFLESRLKIRFSDEIRSWLIYQMHYRPYEEGSFEKIFELIVKNSELQQQVKGLGSSS